MAKKPATSSDVVEEAAKRLGARRSPGKRSRPSKKQIADDIKAAERRVQVLRLRESGAHFQDIAKALNISVGCAHNDYMFVMGELDVMAAEAAIHHRALEERRLDRMHLGLAAGIASGNPRAITAAVAVSARRARLLNLDLGGEDPTLKFPAEFTLKIARPRNGNGKLPHDDD